MVIKVKQGEHYPKTKFWKIGRNASVADCCTWDGVQCDARDGRVTSLDLASSYLYGSIDSASSLFRLVHLRRLNLADNNFNNSRIPSGFGRMRSLTHLNLSFSLFSGQVPPDVLSLTRLVSLDLSRNMVELKNTGLESLARSLTNLQVPNLNFVTISAPVPIALSNLPLLRQLYLKESGLYGVFPSEVFQLPNLELIILDGNHNLTGQLPEFNSSSLLKWLSLEGTSFSHELPDSIGNLRHLEVLDIYSCEFWGPIPSSMSNLTRLTYMDLSLNQFSPQQLSSVSWPWKMTDLTYLALRGMNLQGQMSTSIGNLSQLTGLALGSNQLTGQIPPQILNLTQLRLMFLHENKLSGHIPPWISNMTHLIVLALHSNRFEGGIPRSFSQMENLQHVSLHRNSLAGTVELDTFLKVRNLQTLHLSNNRLSVISNTTTQIAAPELRALGLASCNLGEFPHFLQHQKQLIWIDLSQNNVHGQVPGWIWSFSHNSLEFMNLSRNFLTGNDKDPAVLPHGHLYHLDLSYNKFKRPVPAPPQSIGYYLISGNNLEGEFPPYFCALSELVTLDLSFNNMTGILPGCLGNVSGYLSILNLQGNRFHGHIPEFLASGDQLLMIELSSNRKRLINRLEGKLPKSLANCRMLEFFSLANNVINDTFPYWLGSLPELKVLILRSNKFHGAIEQPGSELAFQKLRIIDLSDNNFSGELPEEYFHCWTSMKMVNSSTNWKYLEHTMQPYSVLVFTFYGSYDYTMTLIYKGIKLHYPKISDVLMMVDFSVNRFQGMIPDTVGELKGLRGLNFSNNLLIGHIPSSLGNLVELESLDLSNNELSGQIPQSLAVITFLSFLNLSNNDLSGQIPRGRQLGKHTQKVSWQQG
ncbi:hypothetical protein MLD38_033448 [Melastoma candidum]|uniref:Uncharacterized protein n=1 Tax=Melastoma candidum TaxID=119954 RepID=A0ACB9M8W9_9MYRT|nr:hypothetical protein MLD38_033448 [Melastoma candidum]